MKSVLLTVSLTLFCCVFVKGQEYGTGDITTKAEISRIPIAEEVSGKEIFRPSYSLKRFTVQPGKQAGYQTCAAWAVATAKSVSYACARGITDGDSLRKYSFSPGYLYHKTKKPQDTNCMKGSSVFRALDTLKKVGVVYKDPKLESCPRTIDKSYDRIAGRYRIKNYSRLNEGFETITPGTILKIKRALKKNHPVVISLKYYPSLDSVDESGIWYPTKRPSILDSAYHAMCIVGYNDLINDSSFEVVNSWGTYWGNGGFFWLSYEQLKTYGRYAIEVFDYNADAEVVTGRMDLVLPDNSNLNVRLLQDDQVGVANDSGRIGHYEVMDKFPTELTFKIRFNMTTTGHVYLMSVADNDSILLMYPKVNREPDSLPEQKIDYTLPSKNNFRIKKGSNEKFIVIFSKKDLKIDEFLTEVNVQKSSLFNALMKSAKAVPRNEHVLFDAQNVQFKIPIRSEDFLVLYTLKIST